MEKYRTIKHPAESRLEINKSEFIGIAYPLQHEGDPEEMLQAVKRNFPGASHYVYAYTWGRNHSIQKFTDDGEPSGTGGMPILELLKHKELENTLVVAIRYYGGVKLGTGGLKRAYSKVAQEAILDAVVVTFTSCRIIRIRCPYHFWGKLQYDLETKGTLVEDKLFEEEVTLTVAVPEEDVTTFIERMNELSSSHIELELLHKDFRQLADD